METAQLFTAQVVGPRVCRGRGAIHSVFARALNLAGEGAWLSVQSPELPLVAHAVQVPWSFCDLRRHFEPGRAWRWAGPVLTIVRRDGARVHVEAQGAAVWRTPLLVGVADARRLAQRAPALWRDCARTAAGRSVFWARAPLPPAAQRAQHALFLLRRARSVDEVEAAVRTLIGLGPGLTPAGDDALIGWLAGMALLQRDPARDRLVAAARRCVAESLARTTDISRAHLEDALAGEFAQALSVFANALAHGEAAAAARRALEDLAECGASSGLDAAAGLLAAVVNSVARSCLTD